MHRIMRPLIWEQLGRTIPGVPVDPWELGALGSDILVTTVFGHPGVPILPSVLWWAWIQIKHKLPPGSSVDRVSDTRAWFCVLGRCCHSLSRQ